MPTIAYENDATSESVINGKTGFKGDNLLELLEISNKIDESECFDFAIKEWGFGAMANSFLKGIQKN
jgi:hypothetical protein